jgi:hypothetical protein
LLFLRSSLIALRLLSLLLGATLFTLRVSFLLSLIAFCLVLVATFLTAPAPALRGGDVGQPNDCHR